MKKLILLGTVLLIFTIVYATEFSYITEVELKENILVYQNLKLVPGESPDRKIQRGEYKASLISFRDKELYSYDFSLGDLIYDYEPLTFDFHEVLVLPYFYNGKFIEVYDKDNNLLLQIDVSKFATCNENRICEENEGISNCPLDCTTEYKVKEAELQQKSQIKTIVKSSVILLVIFALITLILIFFIKRFKRVY